MSYILLIEPDTALARTYIDALEHAGHSVRHVTGVQAGVDESDKLTPDIVIMEIQLPQHSGIEFLHEFRSYPEWMHVPVIVVTNLSPEKIIVAQGPLARDLGVVDVLYKPHANLYDIVSLVRERTRYE